MFSVWQDWHRNYKKWVKTLKFTIKHEKKGRIRVHLFQKYMNYTQADTLQYYLENLDGVKKAQVFNRTCTGTLTRVYPNAWIAFKRLSLSPL